MSVKSIVSKQYRNLANMVVGFSSVPQPPEGWICTIRKSLNLTGAQLGRRLGVSRSNIYKTEKSELNGKISLHTMREIARSMGCHFVYAIIPNEDKIENIIEDQARKKAMAIVKKTSEHMALENQIISPENIQFEIERLTKQLIQTMPKDLWEDDQY